MNKKPLPGGAPFFRKSSPTIEEFLRALFDPFTYDPRRNNDVIFGFLWGLPIPLFSIGLDCWLTSAGASGGLLERGCRAVLERPIHLFFLVHPFLFAAVFGTLGTMRYARELAIEHLISELEDRVRDLDAANEKLKELDRMKSNFLANVSHELRTPLVSMLGYAEMLLDGRLGAIAGNQKEAVETVMRNAEKLHRMVGDLLSFARFEAEPRLNIQSFGLRAMAERVAVTLRPLAQEKGLALLLDSDASADRVLGDPERIEQVLVNLVANAVKFTPAGGRVGIDWALSRERAVRVRVWDEGIGISPEERPRVFERFHTFRSPASGRQGGIGLGLTIVHDILTAHGAPIQIEARPGGGTIISFELPVSDGDLPPGLARRRDAPAPGAAAPAASQPNLQSKN